MSIQRPNTVVGHTTGDIWFDDIPRNTSPLPRIIRIEASYVYPYLSLKVCWNTHDSPWRGEHNQPAKWQVLQLGQDEFITRVDGTTIGGWNRSHNIASVRFSTNHGHIMSVGTTGSEKFSFTGGEDPEADMASRMGLLSLETLWTDGYLCGLRPTFAEYPNPEPRSTITASAKTKVKYESTQSGQQGSAFLRHLTSPMIALHVGSPPNQLTLHVAEPTLCQLPFFTAALHDGFKESTDKAISLPEDTPDVVSALVEFLCTGSYTYAYDTGTVNEEAEGCFHLAVFVVAEKYGCGALASEARKGFREVLSAVAGGAPAVRMRLWRRAYEAGLKAAGNWGTCEDVVGFEAGMVRSVRMVLAECRVEFGEAVREVEGFGVDLMAIAVGVSRAE